jgi:hypothetical protein
MVLPAQTSRNNVVGIGSNVLNNPMPIIYFGENTSRQDLPSG